ncbi:hypothetical protein DL96DRAFT_1608232 [Flagelloscypha sp. PMI_526]|nr:hypothetical protein DL96DRAFT_1608232 [Flagelloscypha sp. PMI_526]
MDASIPTELLLKIAGYLPGAALKQWCLTNSDFLSIGRPKLFSIVLFPENFRNFDSTLLLTGRGKELVVQYTRGIIVHPRFSNFFTGRSKEVEKRTRLLLSLIEEIGKNLRFLDIRDYEDMPWKDISPAILDSLFQHVVPHVHVLAIYGMLHLPLSTIFKSGRSIRHLQLEACSLTIEKMADLGPGILPNLQRLTIGFEEGDDEGYQAPSLSTLLEANSGRIRVLRLTCLDDEQGISAWPVLHPVIETLVYSLESEYGIARPELPPPILRNLHTLLYYFDGAYYGMYWPAVMKRIQKHLLVQPGLRLVEIHLNGSRRDQVKSALDNVENVEVVGHIEMNIFFYIYEGKADVLAAHREVSGLVKEKFAPWIAAGRMQVFIQLNYINDYTECEI